MTSEPSNGNQPVSSADFTRMMTALATDLREIRDTMVTKEDAKQFATKEDLKGFATKEDLQQLRSEMATKADLQELRSEMATKADLQQLKDELNHEFRAAVEIITDEMRGAHKDEISTLQDQEKDHEERITLLERQAGMRP